MKKVIFLLLFPLIAEVVVSCCNCVDQQTFRYSNKSITASNLDGSGALPIVSQADTITRTAFGIRVILEREQLACLQKRPSLFISPAYAFSCECPEPEQYLAKDSVIAIRIFTTAAFDSNHPAGSDVSTYFKLFEHYTMSPVADYVKNWKPTFYDQHDLTTPKDFLLVTPPTLGPEHSFRIEFELSDKRILEATTSPVKLL